MASGGDGTVELVEYYGHDAMVLVRLQDGIFIQARTEPDVAFQRGDQVDVTYVGPGAVALDV